MKNNKTIIILIVLISPLIFNSDIIEIRAKEVSEEGHKLDASTLTILTRHDVTITNAFESAFLASSYASNLGIADLYFYQAITDQGWINLLMDPSKSIDLAWGANVDTFNAMEGSGLLKPIDNSTLITIIDNSIPDEFAGVQMKKNDTSGDYVWIGNAVSSFGYTVNHEALDTYGLPVPLKWEDLASPNFYNQYDHTISMSDPPLSTSNTKIYQIILQTYGWEAGWGILTRMGANAGIYPGSVDVRAAVVSGDVAVAMTIDFYGVIANRENPNCEYIIPDGESIVEPVPIALSTNVDHQAEAEAFIEWLVSPEGQSEWMREGIDRLPLNEDAFQTPYGQTRTVLYELYNNTEAITAISFNSTLADLTKMITIYYFHETISGLHTKLRNTWGEMIDQYDADEIPLSTFLALIEDLDEVYYTTVEEAIDANALYLSDAGQAAIMEAEWRTFAEDKYDQIYEILVPTIPEISPEIHFSYLCLFMILVAPIVRKKLKRKH